MRVESSTRLTLPWSAAAIVALPLAAFASSDWLLDAYGFLHLAEPAQNIPPAQDIALEQAPAMKRHAEAAARLQVLSTFMLFVACALACCGVFACRAARASASTRRRLLLTYAGAVCVGFIVMTAMNTRETQAYMGPQFICEAFGSVEGSPRSLPADPDPGWADAFLGRVPNPDNLIPGAPPKACGAANHQLLRGLLAIERNLLVLAIGSLTVGSIGCLTLPYAGSRTALRRAVEIQASRLNLYLYLSAALLVVGLMFVSAFLHWPSFALADPAGYNAHANALVFYFGVSYSILLASYYAPVALLLSRYARRAGDAALSANLLDRAQQGPMQAAKVAAALFAPALASLFSGLMDFKG